MLLLISVRFFQHCGAQKGQCPIVSDDGKVVAIGRKRHQPHMAFVFEAGDLLGERDIPEFDAVVLAAAGQSSAVRRKGQGADGGLV